MIRDALLNRIPVAFADNGPAFFSLAGCVIASLWHAFAEPLKTQGEERAFLFVDGVGLAAFGVTLVLRTMAIWRGWHLPRLSR